MTTAELRQKLFEAGYPPQFEVDHHTYANACQEVFNHWSQEYGYAVNVVEVWIGSNSGLMFKNTELILKSGG